VPSTEGLPQTTQSSCQNRPMVDWLGLTRFVHIGGSVLLAAIFAFRRVVFNPAIDSVRGGKYTASLGSCFDRLAFWGWMTLVCSGFVWFGLIAASVAGEDSLLAVRPETLELILFRHSARQPRCSNAAPCRRGSAETRQTRPCSPRSQSRCPAPCR
jgi:hypothetical protein